MHDVSNGVQAAHVAPLSIDVISPLESRGLVAETLAANPQRWKGIIRVPQRTEDGMWEDCTERLRQIREKEGHYGQLQILCVCFGPSNARLVHCYNTVSSPGNVRVLPC